MIWNFCTTSQPTAKKDYDCDAWPWINNGELLNQGILSVSDYRSIIKAQRNGFTIKVGEKYVKRNGKFDGDFCTFRAIPSLDDICQKYELYTEC